jgi:hypothetical protein
MSDDGFFSRWSRRKAEVRQGREVEEPAPPPSVTSPAPSTVTAASTPVPRPTVAPPAVTATPEAPLPTLDDVAQLTPDSDFSNFVARGVSPDVKNAAMKKLFADPRFNVMDGMDVYIDDYSQPDPLAPAVLRQMASAKFLRLVDDDAARPGDTPDASAPQVVAQSTASTPLTEVPLHDNADLRLQQDPAARRPSPGSEPE